MKFAERLKEIRRERHLTQEALAERLNVHVQTVSKWERGVSEPDISQLGELAQSLGVSVERLVGAPETELFTGTFDAAAFGKNLSSLRKKRGELQEEVANAAGTTADIVSKWERGIICPDAERLLLLSEHFGVSFSGLYYGIGEEERTETPAAARRRKRFSFAWLGGAAVLGTAAIVCTALLVQQSVPGGGGVTEPEEISYTVTVGSEQYEVGEHDWFTLAPAQRDGYDFVGYAGEDGELADFPVRIEENTAFTPVFAPHEYAIDYWLNGGYFSDTPQSTFTVESGALTLPVPARQGAAFEGWYLAADYAGEAVGSISCSGADVSVYARWSNEVYTVRYEMGGGILYGSNPSEVTQNEAVVLTEPVREGYHFLGWYTSPTGGERRESVGGEGASNLTLYALWQECGDLYTVRYETGGGTLTAENPLSVGAGEVHPLCGAVRTGYDFVGWNTSADGSGTYYEMLMGIRADLTLYAVWTPKIYTVRYELDGGSFYEGANPNLIRYGEEVRLAPAAKYGHTFLGWFTSPTGGERVERIGTDNVLRLSTLYARFSANSYTVRLLGAGGTFSLNGETVREGALTLLFGDEAELPDCLRAGYDFLGWFDEDGRAYSVIDVTNLGDLTLTAKYRRSGLTYPVEYVLNGGILSEGNPANVGYGQVIPLHAPERYGYLFLGWNTRPDGSGVYYTATPAGQETALTLYAVWQEIVVSGSAENFTYQKGQTSVTITGYTGPFGENVDLVIPSYIDGLPVVAIEGRLALPADGEGTDPEILLRSLTFPDTLVSLGKEAVSFSHISQPVVIPAGVKTLGERCFEGANLSLSFAPGSVLTVIGESAFTGSRISNVVTLPEGVKRLEQRAFLGSRMMGLILPDSLEYIGAYALGFAHTYTGNEYDRVKIYLPRTVKYVEKNAFHMPDFDGTMAITVYTALKGEESSLAPGWEGGAEVFYNFPVYSGVTLDFGDGEKQFLAGQVFALPEPQREGLRFIGWYDARENDYAAPLFIPHYEGVVLQAVFQEFSEHDGSSIFSPAVLETGKDYTIILPPLEGFYFRTGVENGRLRITFSGTLEDHPRGDHEAPLRVSYTVLEQEVNVDTGVAFSAERDTVFRLRPTPDGSDFWSYYYIRIRIRIDEVD